MSDLSQNPALVSYTTTTFPLTIRATAGEAITAGQPVYQSIPGGQWFQGLASGSQQQAGQYGAGIAIDSAPGAGQFFSVILSGQINLGATLVPGVPYCISHNKGAIAPYTDLITGDWVTILGIALSTTLLGMGGGGPLVGNQQHA